MKRVGILTFQFADNYGAVLQAYALKNVLQKKGVEVDVINYMPDGLWDDYSLNPFRCIKKGRYRKLLHIPIIIKQSSKFHKFRSNYLKLGEKIYTIPHKTFEKYDSIVVGSDQVWSDSIVPDVSKYFLRGVSGVKKFSYAASFGTDKVSKNVENCIKTELHEFNMLSVREKSAAKIIEENIDKKVYHVSDPVFMLQPKQWRELYLNNVKIKENGQYILYVDLRNDKGLIDKAKKLSDETGLPVYSIHPTGWRVQEGSFKQRYDVGPLEYLSLIDNASYVVTNSFHAVAFSCIFEKKILHYADAKLGSRVADLLYTIEADISKNIIDFSLPDIQNSKEKYAKSAFEYIDLISSLIKE